MTRRYCPSEYPSCQVRYDDATDGPGDVRCTREPCGAKAWLRSHSGRPVAIQSPRSMAADAALERERKAGRR